MRNILNKKFLLILITVFSLLIFSSCGTNDNTSSNITDNSSSDISDNSSDDITDNSSDNIKVAEDYLKIMLNAPNEQFTEVIKNMETDFDALIEKSQTVLGEMVDEELIKKDGKFYLNTFFDIQISSVSNNIKMEVLDVKVEKDAEQDNNYSFNVKVNHTSKSGDTKECNIEGRLQFENAKINFMSIDSGYDELF